MIVMVIMWYSLVPILCQTKPMFFLGLYSVFINNLEGSS